MTDAARGKATFPRAMGEAASREAVESILATAKREMEPLCREPQPLLLLIDELAKRDR